MKWNWQQSDWPEFSWKQARLLRAEALFLVEAGEYAGTAKHLGAEDREQLAVEAMSTEAVTTSEIEGEILDRPSVQSCRQFGKRNLRPASLRRRGAGVAAGVGRLPRRADCEQRGAAARGVTRIEKVGIVVVRLRQQKFFQTVAARRLTIALSAAIPTAQPNSRKAGHACFPGDRFPG